MKTNFFPINKSDKKTIWHDIKCLKVEICPIKRGWHDEIRQLNRATTLAGICLKINNLQIPLHRNSVTGILFIWFLIGVRGWTFCFIELGLGSPSQKARKKHEKWRGLLYNILWCFVRWRHYLFWQYLWQNSLNLIHVSW